MLAYPWRRRLLMPDAAEIGVTAAGVLFGQPGCDCCGSVLPCAVPGRLVFPQFPCNNSLDYHVEVTGPAPATTVVYSGRACDLPFGFPGYGVNLPSAGTYAWVVSDWDGNFTPSATSGTITLTCGGFGFAGLSWTFANSFAYCPCVGGLTIPGVLCDASLLPPIAVSGTKTLTNRFGAVTLSPYPASSPLVINNVVRGSITGGSLVTVGTLTLGDVWAGLQTISACSRRPGCCSLPSSSAPGNVEVLWVFNNKTCNFLTLFAMICKRDDGVASHIVAGAFDAVGLDPPYACADDVIVTRVPCNFGVFPGGGGGVGVSSVVPYVVEWTGCGCSVPFAVDGWIFPNLPPRAPCGAPRGVAGFFFIDDIGDITVTD